MVDRFTPLENMAVTKILITGHLGYVGAALVPILRNQFASAQLVGLDTGFFQDDACGTGPLPEFYLDRDVRQDIRDIGPELLDGVDTIVHLAAVSNDPIGNQFAGATNAINEQATLSLARMARAAGVKKFIFASSCSIYGATENELVDESAAQNPLTEYARSKVAAEAGLIAMADANFQITSLRFGTACGYSRRLRLDLVVNDFVATGVATNKIELLSSGTAWRPFVHVDDMARAICWAIGRDGQNDLVLNIGSDDMCLSIVELAKKVVACFHNSELVVPSHTAADNRSYRVSFSKFRDLAPEHQPLWSIHDTISDLKVQLASINFSNDRFREGTLMRLNKLRDLQLTGKLTDDLAWVNSS